VALFSVFAFAAEAGMTLILVIGFARFLRRCEKRVCMLEKGGSRVIGFCLN
jgi:predicted ABC-type transport system involved in lysophospholipase L1 biosynthesis ATPase subunit